MVNAKRLGKGIGQFVIVSLPTLFTLFWTLDALLVPGSDVFIIALLQAVFIAVYIGYVYWTAG